MLKIESAFGKTGSASRKFVIEQVEYKGLAHFSYIVMANKNVVLIDPRRDADIYYTYAEEHDARIVGIIETHPHADFVSSHLEIQNTLKVPVYRSSLTKTGYPGTSFDEGQTIMLSDAIGLRSMYTPGHAPTISQLCCLKTARTLPSSPAIRY